MYTWKKRLLAAILAGCLSVGLMTPAFAVEGEATQPTTTPEVTESVAPTDEVDPGFSVDPVETPSAETTETPAETPSSEPTETPAETPSSEPTETPAETPSSEPTETPAETPSSKPTESPAETPSSEPTETPAETPSSEPTETPAETPSAETTETPAETPSTEPTESPEVTEIPEETVPGAADPGFTMPDYANMSVEELYAAVKDMSAEDRAIVYSLLTEEQIAALEEYEQQQAQAALEAAYPAIAPQTVSGEDGVSVTVSAPVGAFPAGTTVTIEPVTAPNPLLRALSLEEDKKAVVEDAVAEAFAEEPAEPQQTVAFDITFWLDGQEIQPRDGYTVSVSFEVPNDSALLNGANQLQVFHLEESEDAEPVAQPVGEPVEIDTAAETQEIAVEAESFSIYAVSSANSTNGTLIPNGNIVSYTLGDGIEIGKKLYYYSNNKSDTSPMWGYEGSWASSNGSVAAVTTTDNNKQHATVTIQGSGTTTITYTYWEHKGIANWQKHTESFTLVINPEVIPEGPLTIEDQITTNGSLKAVISGTPDWADQVVSYRWYIYHPDRTSDSPLVESKPSDKNDYTAVVEALNGNELVSVVATQGARAWYIVEALNAGGDVLATSEPYQVPYFDQLMNGSFEYPVPPNKNYDYFYSDEGDDNITGIYWKTTASDGVIEYVRTKDVARGERDTLKEQFNLDYGASEDEAPDGNQVAELNANEAGSLYQDVMAAPGTEFHWSLYHRGRNKPNGNAYDVPNETDTMYVIIMSAEDAKNYGTQKEIDALASKWKNDPESIPEGCQIWELKSDNTKWYFYEGDYTVPDGQYVTRFFFAAGETASSIDTKKTIGNMIDAVNFSDEIQYSIQYYLDGTLANRYSQIGTGDAGEWIATQYTSTIENQGYVLEKIVRGDDETYTDKTGMYLGTGSSHMVLYYVQTGISVNKTVTGVAAEDIVNQTFTFNLYEGNSTSGNVIATASVTLNGTNSGSAIFRTATGVFTPQLNQTYTIVEVTPGAIDGYNYNSTTIEDQSALSYSFTMDARTKTVNVVNAYSELPKSGDLKIAKTISESGKPDQSFIFEITSTAGFKMTVVMNPDDFDAGYCEVTIKDLPAGTYTVEEMQNWSWKYKADHVKVENIAVSSDNPNASVAFTNTEKDDVPWLGGSDSVENVFATTSGASTRMLSNVNPAAQATYPRNTGENTNGNDDDKNKDQNTEPDPSEPMETQEGGVSNV